MPIYTIELDGKQYDIEGDRPPTEAEAREAVGSFSAPQAQATAPPAKATAGMMGQSTMQGDPAQPRPQPLASLGIRFVPDAEWDALSGADRIKNVLGSVGYGIASMTGMGAAGRDAIDHPVATLASAAIPLAAKYVAPGILEGGKRLAGVSKARAGGNMQAAATAAKNVAVNPETAGQAGLRAMELQAAGGRMPRAATQFMQRVTSPDAKPLSFQEAQDFASNLSRLSANEFNSLNPQMARQVTEMSKALRAALTEAAETVGAGDQYARGVSEYAKAAQVAKRWEEAKPALMATLRRLGYAAAAGAGYKGLTGSGQ